jgi:hypothetical protein
MDEIEIGARWLLQKNRAPFPYRSGPHIAVSRLDCASQKERNRNETDRNAWSIAFAKELGSIPICPSLLNLRKEIYKN